MIKQFNVDESQWQNWQWQVANCVTSSETLRAFLPLSLKQQHEIDTCLKYFRMAITPYYLSLINPNDSNDPILKQAVPTINETYPYDDDMLDPLDEEAESPVKNLVHRYPDRVLFLVTFKCAMYCRHCTRRRVVGEIDQVIDEKTLQEAVIYITQHEEIRDVLISGGDPLVMATSKLEHIISAIRAIKHVEVIRIGTRVPVVLPMRITDELVTMLRKYHPIWINTHFNHPKEITEEAKKACLKIVDAGIPLGNQSVLLREINDNTDTMKELLLKLVQIRVRPYYLYQCDLSKGISHFRTPVETGLNIMHELTGFISGFALPRYVIDAPGGGGKIPVNYNYVVSINDKEVIMENYLGKQYRYPQPHKNSGQ